MNNKKQIQELQNLISEIEGQTIKFDSANWPKCQRICVEWGDKLAPFLKLNQDNYKQFNYELDRLRAAIRDPILPSDISGDPKNNAFNKMISIAKQRLNELEHDLTTNDSTVKPEKAWHEKAAFKIIVPFLSALLVAYLVYRFGWK